VPEGTYLKPTAKAGPTAKKMPQPKPISHPSEPAFQVSDTTDEEEEQNDDALLESPVDVAVDVPAPSKRSSLRPPKEDEANDSDVCAFIRRSLLRDGLHILDSQN
jgi:hypothetical protein